VEEGIVPGGGTTPAHFPQLESWATSSLKDEELIGAMIVSRAPLLL